MTGNFTEDPRLAYVADAENHCIRVISVATAYVSTVAGVCGQAGFIDGAYNKNLLKHSELIGMSADGTMFIYHGVNKVIRMMDTSGNV